MIKIWRTVVFALLIILMTGCSKDTQTNSMGAVNEALKPLTITLTEDGREKSLMEDFKGTFFDKPFEVNYWFNGSLNIEEEELANYFSVMPDSVKPKFSIIHNSETETTRICAEFQDAEVLPQELSIILKAGMADEEGSRLKDDIIIQLVKEEKVEAYINLKSDPTINSDTGYDFNSYMLNNSHKHFEVSFNFPMDKKSVEKALMDGFKYIPEEYMAEVQVDWKDDSNLTIYFTNMHEGQAYPISFNGSKTTTGEEYKEFEMNKVFGFLVQQPKRIVKIDSNANIVSESLIRDEILELEGISPDGKYTFGYRFLDNGGDFYPAKPILLELKDGNVEKYFLKDINYTESIIFGSSWMPDSQGFLVYNGKTLWYYTLKEALEGKPGKVIFQYEASSMDYIIGAEISPDGKQIAVFKSEYKDFNEEDSKLVDILFIDFEGNIINGIDDVFYHSSIDGFAIPLKYGWKDYNTIISEGYSSNNDEVNIYCINLKDNKVEVIYEDASNPSLLGDKMVARRAEYDKEGNYMAFGDGLIINLKNNDLEDVIEGNLSYSVYGVNNNNTIAYELYEDKYNVYIYNMNKDAVLAKHKGMLFGSDGEYFYILK